MTVPVNNLSLANLQTEFGGSNPISLSEYYKGGGHVNDPAPTSTYQTNPISGSGTISLGMFRGVTNAPPVAITLPSAVDMYGHPNGPWAIATFIPPAGGGVNATNLHFILTATGGVPSVDPLASYSWYFQFLGGENRYWAGISNPQDSSGSALPIPLNQPNQSIKDFQCGGDQSAHTASYRIFATDGVTTAHVDLNVGFWW